MRSLSTGIVYQPSTVVFGIGRSACAVQFLRLKDGKSLFVFALEIPVQTIFVKSMWNRNPSKLSVSADVQRRLTRPRFAPKKALGQSVQRQPLEIR